MGSIMPVVTQAEFQPHADYLHGADGPQVIAELSKDLAFEMYTRIPEPATCGLVLLGVAGLRQLAADRNGNELVMATAGKLFEKLANIH